MKKLLIIIGTRPEAIKMAPLFLALKKRKVFVVKICLTGQHREMVHDVLSLFNIAYDYSFSVMDECHGQLWCLTAKILENVNRVLTDFQPDCLLVQGDTNSAFAAALAAFYKKIKVGHVEAGLRTYNKWSPFPEEFNRVSITQIADFHFAPTENAKKNLLLEKVDAANILVSGNTVVDALIQAKKNLKKVAHNIAKKKLLLVTLHRRENHPYIESICNAIIEISKKNEWDVIFPVHPNSKVHDIVHNILRNNKNIKLIPPQPYGAFVQLILESDLILSDSGGIQEEATTLHKPLLLIRDTTERPEALETGFVKLVGTDSEGIVRSANQWMKLIEGGKIWREVDSPFGDGKASERIVDFLENKL